MDGQESLMVSSSGLGIMMLVPTLVKLA